MSRLMIAAAAMALVALPARAADPWGLDNEKEVLVTGTVVDLLCTLAGDCPPDCGGGTRQLGILDADGRLYPAAKGNVFFAGAVPDLLPHCGATVTVDGLLIENPAMPLLFVQYLKGPDDAEALPADAFLTEWTARNGEADEWWRADPDARAAIAENGVFGIKGLEPPKE